MGNSCSKSSNNFNYESSYHDKVIVNEPKPTYKLYYRNRTEAQYILFHFRCNKNLSNKDEAYIDAMELINSEIKDKNASYITNRDSNNDDILNTILYFYSNQAKENDLLKIISFYDNLDTENVNCFIPVTLFNSVTIKYESVLKAVLDKTNNMDCLSISGWTPIYTLILYDCSEDLILEQLKKVINIDIKHKNNKTYLYCAIEHKMYRVAKELINRGCNVNTASNGHTPLTLCDNPEIVQMLLDKGADPNKHNPLGHNLCRELKDDDVENVKKICMMLINHPDCNVNISFRMNFPIYYAIEKSWNEIILAIARKSPDAMRDIHITENIATIKNKTCHSVAKYSVTNEDLFDDSNVLYQLALISPSIENIDINYLMFVAEDNVDKSWNIVKDKKMDIHYYADLYENMKDIFTSEQFITLLKTIPTEELGIKLDSGKSLLILTCEDSREDIALSILDRYIDFSSIDENGYSAIYYVNKNNLTLVAKRIKELKKLNEEITI
jgi:hypothetical protein